MCRFLDSCPGSKEVCSQEVDLASVSNLTSKIMRGNSLIKLLRNLPVNPVIRLQLRCRLPYHLPQIHQRINPVWHPLHRRVSCLLVCSLRRQCPLRRQSPLHHCPLCQCLPLLHSHLCLLPVLGCHNLVTISYQKVLGGATRNSGNLRSTLGNIS